MEALIPDFFATTLAAAGFDVMSAVSEPQVHARSLQTLLDYDAQTYLLTRRAFLARAEAAVERKRLEARRRCSWVVLAMEAMPAINSLHGAEAGDDVLARMATLLRRNLLPGDSAGRYNGATFALLLDDVRPREAESRLDHLRRQLAQTEFRSVAGRFHATFVAGIAELSPEMTADAWAEAAEQALAAARQRRR